eukprot:CAMPEP_0197942740 /NCGR_PEP_ID=MMETSP1439-20131203/124563_1 /TAXON_ID=66791 /ORGANISM="Gonyaulax spinifera, Strain CCMP409" /LENGTH=235 /DNA_ID=CAMNT_0043565997 /DNA_START=86 /DNA_END=793 /DNA_ORIENTATION=+
MPRARAGTRRAIGAVAAVALAAAGIDACCRPAAFAAFRAAVVAGALLTSSPSYADFSVTAPGAYGADGSSVQLSAKSINLGGQAQDGGLDGTYEQKVKANRKDMIDDDKALAQEEKFEQKFDPGALLTSSPSYADFSATTPGAYGMEGSSMQLAAKSINLGGQAQDGGLDGTYEQKIKANRKDMIDDDKALAQEEKFEQKFDQYIGVFGILFVGAFIAPMVTYFWYVRDSDPWSN